MIIARALILAAALALGPAAPLAQAADGTITVVDGDTVDWRGKRYRLTGYDTPEISRAACPAEKALGYAASWRLQYLIWGGGAVVEPSGRQDRYGRELGRLIVKGRDVADILIGEGLARRYEGGRRKGWCGS